MKVMASFSKVYCKRKTECVKVNSVSGDGEVQNKYVMNNIPQERRQISHKQTWKKGPLLALFFNFCNIFLQISFLLARDEST